MNLSELINFIDPNKFLALSNTCEIFPLISLKNFNDLVLILLTFELLDQLASFCKKKRIYKRYAK